MADNHGSMVVFTNAKTGREREFRDWYAQTHLVDIVTVPGIESASLYELSDIEVAPGGLLLGFTHVAVYELAGDTDTDFSEVADGLRDLFSGGRAVRSAEITRIKSGPGMLSDALDLETIRVRFLRHLATCRSAEIT